MSAIKVEVYDPRLERMGSGRRAAAGGPAGTGGSGYNLDAEGGFNMSAEAVREEGPYEAFLRGASPEAIRQQVGRY